MPGASNRLAQWLAALVVGAPTAAQAPAYRELRTADGSRFVLVPTGGPDVVHWVVATPAGLLDDPPGFEGLAVALARASLAGTDLSSSRAPDKEALLLAWLDQHERTVEQATALGVVVPEAGRARIAEVRREAAALNDDQAWVTAVRAAPALGPRLSTLPEGVLLHITTTANAIPAIGRLLVQRREGKTLRGVPEQFRAVRDELVQARGGARGALRRELLGLAFPGHRLGKAWTAPPPAQLPNWPLCATVWHNTQHPTRTCHVLVGGFDVDAVARALDSVFARTALFPTVPPEPPPRPTDLVARSAELRGFDRAALAVGYHLPATTPYATAALVAWLAGDAQALLPRALRRAGVAGNVSASAPFPTVLAPMLLIEVEAAETEPTSAALLAIIDTALRDAAQRVPTAPENYDANARARAEAVASGGGGAELAAALATRCGLRGDTVAQALQPAATLTATELGAVAQRVLDSTRVVVHTETGR